jgi:TonB family protein
MRLAKSQAISIALHIGLMAAMVWLGSRSPSYLQSPVRPAKVTSLSAPRMRIIRLAGEARSGGSNRSQLPARRGVSLPSAHKMFVQPDTAPHSVLPLLQTIAFTGSAPEIDAGQTGDPFSLYASGAFGFGGEGSIGDGGCCGGAGPGKSGSPGYSAEQLSRMTPPRLLYRVEPEFSEEARKAKHQGVVVLYIDIDTSGRARNIRVARQLGLGLDEKAVEAVSEWRFRPAYLDGKSVVASAVVEVNFHLL